MERIKIELGDFLKNAGIVGMIHLLEYADEKPGETFGMEGQTFWITREFADNADWTDLYFKAFVHYLEPEMTYTKLLEIIERTLEKLQHGTWKPEKKEKDEFKFINEKLLSNSYRAGFENIKKELVDTELYEKLKDSKLSERIPEEKLRGRLCELKRFLKQPLCRETFCMKNIIYNHINRFWDNKCFLLRANANKNMREQFERDFSEPLRKYLTHPHSKTKEHCIDCDGNLETGEKVSIAFMKDMADDLSRKRSAFWNGRVDAYLCPLCAFLYALAPLGFQRINNTCFFININEDVKVLLRANRKTNAVQAKSVRDKTERVSSWPAMMMNLILEEKEKELSNIQVIIKPDESSKYIFDIIHKDTLKILQDEFVRKSLRSLAEHPWVKIENKDLNIYEEAVVNILQYKNQYNLLNLLLKLSLQQEESIWSASMIFRLQCRMKEVINMDEGGREKMAAHYQMVRNGYVLREELLRKKNQNISQDESLRGTIYQLINALAVKNKDKFLEIVLRLYCACQLQMPNGFYCLLKEEEFLDNGYAFLLGLKGSYKKEETKE